MKYLIVFFISMLPFIEIRGSMFAGYETDIPFLICYFLSVFGNMLPVPFILLFIKRILGWMKRFKKMAPIAEWIEERANKRTDKVTKYATFGLMLFVGIPLPGTGAWTGSLIAALLDMKPQYTVLSILAGVLISGLIMGVVWYGVLGLLSF